MRSRMNRPRPDCRATTCGLIVTAVDAGWAAFWRGDHTHRVAGWTTQRSSYGRALVSKCDFSHSLRERNCRKLQIGELSSDEESIVVGSSERSGRREIVMKAAVAVILSSVLATATLPTASSGAEQCPAEVTEAKAALKSAQASLKKSTQVAKGQQDVQAPRALAGAKAQDVQAPRGNQDVQAPRGNQDVQAPRGNQDVQAPRGNQDVQAPRGNQDVQAPRTQQDKVKEAGALIRQADAACKRGDMATSAQKAKEALAVLQ